MAIEAMKGAGMSYAGSSSASDVKAESQAKVETASNAAASDDLMKKTIQIDTKETDKNGKDGNRDDSQAKQTISENSQIKKAVDEINKKAHNSEAVFGIHDATNRVTIKIVDKDTVDHCPKDRSSNRQVTDENRKRYKQVTKLKGAGLCQSESQV